MRVVKPALINNRNQENETKKVSSTPHLLIATEISELRPVLLSSAEYGSEKVLILNYVPDYRITDYGFTHICGKTRKGKFTVLRKTMRKRWHAKLKEVYGELWRRMHDPVPEQGAYLRSVIMGHARYYGVPMNGPSVAAFRKEVCWLWSKVLKRRSQKHNLTWERMKRLIDRWLPVTRVCHPYPLVRFGVTT